MSLYDAQGRISKWIFSESGPGEKIREHFEYDSSGVMIKMSHYINDTLDYIQNNKWSGNLPESAQVQYYRKGKAVEYILTKGNPFHKSGIKYSSFIKYVYIVKQ
ncbi:MAG: hypothetical protein EOP54_04355 [Sphingobacteriales bacterium]|nr:MAG: hypothetical protein EOP54_04355 [Sphingobacteriales bacterium]